jgi:hypothetical protein
MQWIARVNRSHFTVAFVGLLVFVSTFGYLQSLNKKVSIAQLSNNVSSGSTITKEDIKFVEISQDSTISRFTITEKQFESRSFVARLDLSKSDLLTISNTARRSTPNGLQSMSIGIELERANGGDLKKHDLIDVWKTGEEAKLVAEKLSIRKIISPDKRLGISTSKVITIVVAVTASQAKELSFVIGSNDVMVVLSTGSKALQTNIDSEITPKSQPVKEGSFVQLVNPKSPSNIED